jgi:hypothetical protein
MNQPARVRVGQEVTERNLFLLLGDKLKSDR